jgi:hypothetical protein
MRGASGGVREGPEVCKGSRRKGSRRVSKVDSMGA